MFGKHDIPSNLIQDDPAIKTIFNEVLSMDENEKQLLIDIMKSIMDYKERYTKELR